MFIIRVLFYSLEGLMGSSFLTAINLGLSFYCAFTFLKFCIQFGLPNHPSRFLLYLVTLCVTGFFVMKVLVSFELINPFFYVQWQALPIIIGSLGLLWQVIFLSGQFSMIQKKIISRIPLMAGLLIFSFFRTYANWFFSFSVLISVLFLSVFVGKSRYEKRAFIKMSFFVCLLFILKFFNYFWSYVIGELLFFPALFYLFIFEQSYGVSALVQEHLAGENE